MKAILMPAPHVSEFQFCDDRSGWLIGQRREENAGSGSTLPQGVDE